MGFFFLQSGCFLLLKNPQTLPGEAFQSLGMKPKGSSPTSKTFASVMRMVPKTQRWSRYSTGDLGGDLAAPQIQDGGLGEGVFPHLFPPALGIKCPNPVWPPHQRTAALPGCSILFFNTKSRHKSAISLLPIPSVAMQEELKHPHGFYNILKY